MGQMIDRPDLVFDEDTHSYFLDGKKLAGVSTVAKIGEDAWGPASAWGFRIGYEGAHDILGGLAGHADNTYADRTNWPTQDELRELLKEAGLTPWNKVKEAQNRGLDVHDALEQLAQNGTMPHLPDFPEDQRGYVEALTKWYIEWAPSFEATEVQVVSAQHKFAGRYDFRATIKPGTYPRDSRNTISIDKPSLEAWDLKTSKDVYPTTHYVQLEGYELAGVEMGYPKTDARRVLNCKADGSYKVGTSVATGGHFLAYLAAQRAILDIKNKSKKRKA